MKNTHNLPRFGMVSAVTMLAAFTLAGCGNGADADAEGNGEPWATAELTNAQDDSLGQVEFFDTDDGVEVVVDAQNLEEGFYGFHIHEIGECEPDSQAPDDPEDTGDFLSAGGHIPGEDDADHPEHAGDLPVLLVKSDGTGQMSVTTDRLDDSNLFDTDGAAVMIHADADNYGNVPDRYLDGDDPDDDTLATGDAGDRLGCGVIEG